MVAFALNNGIKQRKGMSRSVVVKALGSEIVVREFEHHPTPWFGQILLKKV